MNRKWLKLASNEGRKKLEECAGVGRPLSDCYSLPSSSFLLPSFSFSSSHNSWLPLEKATTSVSKSELKALTYNVWFDRVKKQERTAAIANYIAQHRPDFVGLQEMQTAHLEVLLDNTTIRQHYYVSDITGSTLGSYGVLLLSTIPFASLRLCKLETNMQRSALLGEFIINNQRVQICTVHLESLSNRFHRRCQMETIAAEFTAPTTLVMGDFNFDSKRNFRANDTRELENIGMKQVFPKHKDVWEHLHPNENGYTFDTETNVMLRGHNPERMRYDRILFCSSTFQPTAIELIGNEKIKEIEGMTIYPSDHYGLVSTFSISSASSTTSNSTNSNST